MLEYWWLLSIPVLMLALSPSLAFLSDWRARSAQRRSSAVRGGQSMTNPDLVADFAWIAALVMTFAVLINFRP